MSKIRKSARGENCQVRIPSICNHNPETVVLAHLSGGGMGAKRLDLHGAYCCSACHDAIDGRVAVSDIEPDTLRLWFLQGMVRTQEIMVNEGLVKLS